MTTNYFQESKLDCNRNNEDFTRYISDLKILFEKAKTLEDSGEIEELKNILMGEFGKFIPNIYNIAKEARQAFLGEYADKTIEILLRYNEIYDSLSDERVNFLTGYNVEVTRNRIKLFLMQQIRDIDSVLSLLQPPQK